MAGQRAPPRMFVGRRGEGLGDGPSHHLRAAVAEDPLRRAVGLHDAALVVHDQHRVRRRHQHGRLEGLALPQSGLPLGPLREVLGRAYGDAGTRAGVGPLLHEGADDFPRVPAQDEELDAAARPVVLADDLSQRLQLPVVPGDVERRSSLSPISSAMGDSKRIPLTLMLRALPSTMSPPSVARDQVSRRTGMRASRRRGTLSSSSRRASQSSGSACAGTTTLAPAARSSSASAWPGWRLTATMAAGRVSGSSRSWRIAPGASGRPPSITTRLGMSAAWPRSRRRGPRRRTSRCRRARGRFGQVAAQVRRGDDEDLGHGGKMSAAV